jgi:hypothetical protein
MAFHNGIFAEVGYGVEVQVEGCTVKETLGIHPIMPGAQQLTGLGVVDAGGILRQVTLLGECIQSGKQRQSFVCNQRHHVTVTLDRPQLQRQASAQSVIRRDHLRSWQMSGLDQCIQLQPHQIGNKQEETPTAGRKCAWGQRKLTDIGNRFDGGTGALGALLIQTPWQRSESLFFEDLPHGGRTEGRLLFF